MAIESIRRKESIPHSIHGDNSLNINYKVWVYSSEYGGVTGYLPETIDISVESEWQAPFEQSGVSTLEVLAQTVGYSTKFVYQSRMMWAGTKPIQLTLALVFFARENAKKEVVDPCNKLIKMSLPTVSKGKLKNLVAPGPVWNLYGKQQMLGDEISVEIGNIILLSPVVFTNVTITYSSILSPEGHPMKAIATINLSTAETWTGEKFG